MEERKEEEEEEEEEAQTEEEKAQETERETEEEKEAAKVIRDVKKILKANRKSIDAVTKAYRRADLVTESKLDHKLPHVERFVKKVASKSSDILLGYHGTSAENATAIMAGGFCPKMRRSSRGASCPGPVGAAGARAACSRASCKALRSSQRSRCACSSAGSRSS